MKNKETEGAEGRVTETMRTVVRADMPRFVVAVADDRMTVSIGVIEWDTGHPGFVLVRWGAEVSLSYLPTAELLPVSKLVGHRLCFAHEFASGLVEDFYKERNDRLEERGS